MEAAGERVPGDAEGEGGAARAGEVPPVVALPADEALAVLRAAGWDRVEVGFTGAPARRQGPGQAGAAIPEDAAPAPGDTGGGEGETYVVRQRLVDGAVHLTMARHPGGPWPAAAAEESGGGG